MTDILVSVILFYSEGTNAKGDEKVSDTRKAFMQDLQRIEAEHYQLRAGEELEDFVTLMLQYIGDPDPELRDGLIYPTFYTWIREQNRFTEAQLRSLLAVLTDEQHLLYRIGSEGDESVFTRTFSVLPIALILWRHGKQPFLSQADLEHVKHALLRNYREEQDLRGFLPEEGWAHSAAHGADALDELVQCCKSDAALQRDVLAAVSGMLHNGKHIFSEEEDERITTLLVTMMDHELLPEQEIAAWINSLTDCSDHPSSRSHRIARTNSKSFLRSLYFRKRQDTHRQELVATILAAEDRLNKFT